MTRILIVEDDEAILKSLKDDLEFEGFSVSIAGNGQDGLDKGLIGCFHLIILDILLPRINGFDVCRKLREAGVNTPVLMLTAARTREIDKVKGLELGADDYVTKPFGASELMARVKAILRRTEQDLKKGDSFFFNNVAVDFKNHQVEKKGEVIHLTFLEFEILSYLIHNRDKVVSRDELLDSVWGDAIVSPRTIEPHIVYLRKKLEENPAEPHHILTVRGIGYRFKDK